MYIRRCTLWFEVKPVSYIFRVRNLSRKCCFVTRSLFSNQMIFCESSCFFFSCGFQIDVYIFMFYYAIEYVFLLAALCVSSFYLSFWILSCQILHKHPHTHTHTHIYIYIYIYIYMCVCIYNIIYEQIVCSQYF